MSNSTKTHAPRATTFTVKTVAGKRQFMPVNKRAKAIAELAGVKTLTRKHLVQTQKLGFRTLVSPTLETIKL
jgi:hypothetical protein